ncbi:HAMP domain-containing sensor histidine kinase [Clostridium sp. D53t1_180928_C8]|uniref:sensor histidine kinase n=1 Tax=Clostridium sp. D53t1_180928_C8 TaxID=2787101 RepID=UPI0018AADE38|nr:HAMP domain-containing sensor histidine kinase [Clostridium sp. D53t1_180928_C8]
MEIKAFDDNVVKKQSKKVIKYIYIVGTILIILFIFKIFRGNENVRYITSIAFFTRTVNGLMAVISIVSCLILYKKTRDSILYILVLVYLGLAIAVLSGQLDYYTFFNYKFNVSNYISMTTSLLRIILLFSAIMPSSRLCKFISKYKVESFVFVAIYSLIAWKIEKIFFVGEIFSNKSLLFIFNMFICIAYTLVAMKLLIVCINKNKVVIGAFSVSLFLISVKSIYILYTVNCNSFNMKLMSALLTYISFFTVIIGAVVELYLLYKESQYLNGELKKFYNLANFNNHTYMFICDKDCNISFMNNKIKEDYNYKIDNNEFKNELLRIKASEEKVDEIMEELYSRNNWRGIISNLKRNAMVDCSIQLINSEKDEQQILVTYLDMSENIKLHSEIESHRINDIKKSEFISTLSHELKTPLNIFYSIIQLLDKTESIGIKEFKETYDKYSSSLKLNSKRMLRLVNNIVDSTRIDSGVFKAEFGNYEIVSIIEDIVISTVPFAQSKNISIEFDTNVEEHFIKCDPAMIEKIVLNLVSNSIKYTKNEGYIKIDITLQEETLEIFFEDTGIGIPDELKDKIFDRFSRVDSSLKRVNEGSGIGLSIVKSMIEVHNGSISVESSLNRGSVFEVKLPNVLIEDSPMVIYEFNKANTELELSDIYN